MKVKIMFIFLLVVSGIFGWFLFETLNAPKYNITINDTATIELDRDRSFYLLYDSFLTLNDGGRAINVTQNTIYSLVQLHCIDGNQYDLFIKMKNINTNDYIYLNGHGDNTTITIQNKRSLGKFNLEKATYEITISPASQSALSNENNYHFVLYPTSLILNIFILVFTSALIFVLIGMIIVFYANISNNKEKN